MISTMKPIVMQVKLKLDSMVRYLTPLLPMVNAHMVEFLTRRHWETVLPRSLAETLDGTDMDEAVERFWRAAQDENCVATDELEKWVVSSRSHHVSPNDTYCLSAASLQERVAARGGTLAPPRRVKHFVKWKKSYEISVLSSMAAGICSISSCGCCVEAGGGRGDLLAALCAIGNVRAVTVDCDSKKLIAAASRTEDIQKQCIEHSAAAPATDRHRFAQAFVTSRTDMRAVAREAFPELADDARIMLTGLHTCGDLGPASLRIFASQPSVAALLTMPCCYHLLSEPDVAGHLDVFQRDHGTGERKEECGFPMSRHLTGFALGYNARTVAAQSLARVASKRVLPARSLLYRAALQVLIEKHLPDHAAFEGKLKRASKKCDNFHQYFKMADNILKLNLYDSLPETYLIEVCNDMESQWKRLVLFYLLRLSLAQVIEGVLLLDRLLFLYENGFEEACLVKLFDPVLSPRCHAIVAWR